MRRLLLLSMMRSGTNWVMDVVGRVPRVLCLREAFSPMGVYGLNMRDGAVGRELAAHLGLAELDEIDPELIAFVRRDPEGFLSLAETATAEARCDWLGVTIFDRQLPDETLRGLIAHPDTSVMILKRQHLPRVISLRKGRLAGAWKTVDTTGMRPELPMEELTEAMTAAERWFGFIENALTETGTPVARLTYEEHVLGGPEVLLAALAEALPGFAWSPGDPVPPSRLPRQDRTEDVFDRIANGAALRAELDAAGLAGAALGYPGSSSRS